MSKKRFGNLILGVAIGASLGILFAPKKGSQTRRELKEKMLDLVSNAKELTISDVSKMYSYIMGFIGGLLWKNIY